VAYLGVIDKVWLIESCGILARIGRVAIYWERSDWHKSFYNSSCEYQFWKYSWYETRV